MAAEGIEAKGFAADVRDPSSLAKVLERMTETLGPIDVFQYSPLPRFPPAMRRPVSRRAGAS